MNVHQLSADNRSERVLPLTCAATCKWGEAVAAPAVEGVTQARCKWVTGSQDEAGDRMPAWAWQELCLSPEAVGPDDRAETCPAWQEK